MSGFTGFLEYNPLCVDSAEEERYSLLKGDFCHGKFKRRIRKKQGNMQKFIIRKFN
ncbi:hypothetical protein J14TS5_17000 [Paenibacillus lautus]|nr:hypothetical protein J14TS5_17000 [Paenibacillus lautus]